MSYRRRLNELEKKLGVDPEEKDRIESEMARQADRKAEDFTRNVDHEKQILAGEKTRQNPVSRGSIASLAAHTTAQYIHTGEIPEIEGIGESQLDRWEELYRAENPEKELVLTVLFDLKLDGEKLRSFYD